ncbi:MAG TPA: RDD family protein [Planctomycetaceae bacterium]|jgi:uncharacterized RDD family membrane protein YckC|nr:RDD family protein [Planctomycetaceae bacterium]
MSEPPAGKAGWIAVYILRRGRQYRVSLVDAPLADGWTIDDEQSVCLEASTDLGKLKEEVDRRCQPPLSRAQALAMVAALRGHVFDQSAAGTYSTVELSDEKYATLLRRFFARWIDGLIFLPLSLVYIHGFSQSQSVYVRVVACVIASSAALVYSIWMHGKYGQTLGKMACKVIVLDVSEQPLSMRQAVLRDIFGVVVWFIGLIIEIPRVIQGVNIFTIERVSAMDLIIWYASIAWFVSEVITVFANQKRRALHDFIAGSVVIRCS